MIILKLTMEKLRYITTCLYIIILLLTKAAILLQWLHLFVPSGTRNTFFWICYAVLCINTLFYASMFFVHILQCRPIRAAWDPMVLGKCLGFENGSVLTGEMGIVAGSINVASDTLILILPHKVIRGLQLNRKKKLGVSVVFAVGVL